MEWYMVGKGFQVEGLLMKSLQIFPNDNFETPCDQVLLCTPQGFLQHWIRVFYHPNGQKFPLCEICSCDDEEINLSGMSRSLVSSRIIRYGVGRSVSWPGRTFTWQIFLVVYMWWLDRSRLYVLFADIWLAQKEISQEVMLTGSPHPVVEADNRPLLNITLGEQALPRPWDAALTNLLIHKLINYFEAKGAAQLCVWGRENKSIIQKLCFTCTKIRS